MAKFFIDRPIFAWVLAIVLMPGRRAIAIHSLPIAQYPPIAPPAVAITVTYPGASAETVQSTVVQVIEQQLSGIDHLLYFSSESDKDGSMTITLNFEQGTNPDIAQVQVQNKLAARHAAAAGGGAGGGHPRGQGDEELPPRRRLLFRGREHDGADIADFIASTVQDPVSRTPGVGDYILFGSQYAMRIWLDPAKLNNYSLTPVDVSNAIAGAERAGGLGRAGRPTVGQGAGAQRHGHRALAATSKRRRVRQDPAPGQSGRLAGAAAGCGAGRAGRGKLCPQRQVRRATPRPAWR